MTQPLSVTIVNHNVMRTVGHAVDNVKANVSDCCESQKHCWSVKLRCAIGLPLPPTLHEKSERPQLSKHPEDLHKD